MDPDEQLARALQEEELRAVQQQSSTQDGQAQFLSQLENTAKKVLKCEDELLQAMALSLMPLEELKSQAADQAALAASLGDKQDIGEEDLLAKGLVKWFKTEFFSWVDKPCCAVCTCTDTIGTGVCEPTAEERAHEASRTELFKCKACESVNRFPRYNDVQKLLETRCGRCGEWANAFLLFCRAAGLTARYVLDWTDHVWTEYYSQRLKRWVHMDSCEASWDQPLLYESGWGKKLSYVLAIGRDGVVDVTRRYTSKWEELRTRRTLVTEDWLAKAVAGFTDQIRKGLALEQRMALELRDVLERQELQHIHEAAQPEALPGRQTGSLEWRSQRGETERVAAGDPPPAPPRPPTAFRRAPQLPQAFVAFGHLQGGACRASGENGHEAADNAFDGRATTKWLDFGGGRNGEAWLEYRILQGSPACTVSHYDVVSANDCPERDPCTWVLEGVVEGGAAGPGPASSSGSGGDSVWQELDRRTGIHFSRRHEPLTFRVASPLPCRQLRLRITATSNPSAADCAQLACLLLHALPAAWDVSAAAAQVLSAEHGQLEAAASTTLRKLLTNLRDHPEDPRFRKVRASKVGALLSSPGAVALLASCSFRPLTLADEGQAGKLDTFLVVVEGPEVQAAARATSACAALEGQSSPGSAVLNATVAQEDVARSSAPTSIATGQTGSAS